MGGGLLGGEGGRDVRNGVGREERCGSSNNTSQVSTTSW